MHAVPVKYKKYTILPLAVGTVGSFAAMVIITTPDGIKWPSGILGDLPTANEACLFAIAYAKWDINGRRGDRPKTKKKFVKMRPKPPTDMQ